MTTAVLDSSAGFVADANHGRQVARRWCVSCHVVAANQRQTTTEAPPFAAIARKHPKRFIGFFTLPTASIQASLDELERSVNELGLRGFGAFANLNGQALDREELFPIYERLVKYQLPVYIHPTAPLAAEAVGIDIMPTLIFGWAFDSTVAMTRLVYGRVLERFPEINWVVADVGGVLAFFAQRAINIYTGRTDEIRHKYGLQENPLDSFRRFYVDTADHPASTLRCVKDFFGADRMVFPIAGDGNNAASEHALDVVRSEVLPSTLGTVNGVEAYATGGTAVAHDFAPYLVILAFVQPLKPILKN
jgi:predicted TIM-barrel fold metal-dependent hydrolase